MRSQLVGSRKDDSISEAMARGRLVIATNYSGPEDYLCEENSILLPYELVNVTVDSKYGFFDESMKWAEPDLKALTKIFTFTCRNPYADELLQKRNSARLISDRFSCRAVSQLIHYRLKTLEKDVLKNRRFLRLIR